MALRPGAAAKRRGVPLACSLLVAIACGAPTPALAQEMDPGAAAIPDSVFTQESQPGPSYQTVYDRDRSRSNWTQTLTYYRGMQRFAFNGSGSVTTQDFLAAGNKSTFGDFYGHMDGRITRNWIVSLDGRFGMNSSVDARRKSETRNNRLQIRTQYHLQPRPTMMLTGALYTEFQQDHQRSTQTVLDEAIPEIDPGAVDTLKVQQDSSYTSARQDGLSGLASWNIKPWLEFYGSALASRKRPSQRSEVRDFLNPLDGSGGGHSRESIQTTHDPSDNTLFSSRVTFTRIPLMRTVFGFQSSSLNQSRFDQQLRGQEHQTFDRNAGTVRFEYGPRYKTFFFADASLVRSLQDFQLRRSSNSLATTRQVSSTLSYSEVGSGAGLTFQTSRARYERQQNQNGLVINRTLFGNGYRRISRRLSLDGFGNMSLQSSRFENPKTDQDILRRSASVGGGYLLAPTCSTVVHFSVNRTQNVAIDPSASGSNNAQTIYQMNASMQFVPTRNFSIRQNYLLSADYKIFDYTERQNYLNRVRRIDTDFVDSLFTFAFLRLTHSFIYRDFGAYFRNTPSEPRTFRIASEIYEQTLAITVGLELTAGVRLIGTQSLLNQRNLDVPRGTTRVRNHFSLNGGLEVNRTLPGGSQIIGALRHVGGYDERVTPQTPTLEEAYWIAGVTFQKDF
jgi:hypothetical protein